MNPLTEKQIRASIVNASRGEANRATVPELDEVRWADFDYFGWHDRKAPLDSYVVLEIDGRPVGIRLRAADAGRTGRKALCAWCEDIVVTDDVSLYVARRGGASGRRGNTVGTLICTQFVCSANVRRNPTYAEAGNDESMREHLVESRIAGLRERSTRFVQEILSTR
ncbi:FBP domain-containing protein [Paraoerskovia marina]|uniref:FBP domain-containing protein n=1 Tax=Paraoerskovia marina TaxID=545619 RepID=UPI00049279B7|nr:FBP domain-containing protein [Paraoerskovia marina]